MIEILRRLQPSSFFHPARIKITSLTAGHNKIQVDASGAAYDYYNIADVYNGAISNGLMNLRATDNYGDVFDGSEINDYNWILGLAFTTGHVVGGTAEIVTTQVTNGNGKTANVLQVKVSKGVTSFDLTATASNGLSATTEVVVKQ